MYNFHFSNATWECYPQPVSYSIYKYSMSRVFGKTTKSKKGEEIKKAHVYAYTTHIVMFRSRWFATPSEKKYCIPAVYAHTSVCVFVCFAL